MTTQCAKCGLKSEIERAFVPVKPLLGQKKLYCPACYEKHNLKEARNTLRWSLLSIPLSLLFLWLAPDDPIARIWILLPVVILFNILTIPLHELGHVLVGRLMNFRIFAVFIGVGQPVLKARRFGIQWELRQIPLGGATLMGSPDGQHYRLRRFIAILAGPAVHAALCGLSLLYYLTPLARLVHPWVNILVSCFLWVNLVLLVINLFPHKVGSGYGQIGSDGLQMIEILGMPQAKVDEHLSHYDLMDAIDAINREDLQAASTAVQEGLKRNPTSEQMINVRGVIELSRGEIGRSRATFVELLEARPNLQPEMKYLLQNNIACTNIYLDDPALLPQADAFSAEAYQNAPWQPEFSGTRGAVLIELGQVDEGLPLVQDAMQKAVTAHSKALDACFVAIGEARRGNAAEARRYLDAARQLDPDCLLLAMTERKIADC